MAEVLSGQRESVGLSSLLQLVESEGLSGWLDLGGSRVGFNDGRVVQAEHDGLSGKDALGALFLDSEEGPFAFTLEDSVSGSPMGESVALIMDSVRLSDEWMRLRPMRLARRNGAAIYEPGLEGVVDRFDGDITVIEAVLEARAVPVQVVDPLLKLIEAGKLVQAAPSDPKRVDKVLASAARAREHAAQMRGMAPDDLLDLARDLLRERDFHGAVRALEACVEVDPDNRVAAQNLRRALQLRDRAES